MQETDIIDAENILRRLKWHFPSTVRSNASRMDKATATETFQACKNSVQVYLIRKIGCGSSTVAYIYIEQKNEFFNRDKNSLPTTWVSFVNGTVSQPVVVVTYEASTQIGESCWWLSGGWEIFSNWF